MTRLCVAIFVTEVATAKRDIVVAAEHGADLVELRIDTHPSFKDIAPLVLGSPIPCIVTCRPTWEGGQSEESDGSRELLLALLGHQGAAYLDIELETLERSNEDVAALGQEGSAQVIVSSHDFQGRPDRLYNILSTMDARGSMINKVVWTARTIRDNLEAFEILQYRHKPTIALCMGEAGLISRVLARKFGAFLTFCGVRESDITAPGQLSIDQMKRLYRWDAIGPKTKVYGVVGSPVAHSMSPAIHNAAFDKTGHDGIYLPLLVNEGYESFKAFMESFLGFGPLDLAGLSITIPHKENALKYLREKNAQIEPLAEQIGAVNTIAIDRSGGTTNLRGLNTDYGAILDSITAKLKIERAQLAEYRVAVIGAGGTGRTAVAALSQCGATVVVYNRTRERADALANEFNGHTGKVVAADLTKLCDSCCQIYINTTSIGMHPNVDATPFADAPPRLGPDQLVFDAVYNPIQTRLLREAQAAGALTVSGVDMFVRQAAAQFEAWTGLPAPTEILREVVERKLLRGS